MLKQTRLWLAACAILLVVGCGSSLFIRRTVYVQDGDVVRLREPVRAKVWVKVDGQWEPTFMTIPEGWYALHLPKENDSPE
jgi:hypothetical protein